MVIFLYLVIGLTNDQIAWCERLILGEPTTHIIQDGEYLSVIAKQYYGDASYWRELALVNRAPNSNLVFPGEEIIVPKKSVIEQIKRSRRLSQVNQFVKGEEDILARLEKDDTSQLAIGGRNSESTTAGEPVVLETTADQTTPSDHDAAARSSRIYTILLIIGVLLLFATIGLLIYRKRNADRTRLAITETDMSDEERPEAGYDDYVDRRDKKKQYVVETN